MDDGVNKDLLDEQVILAHLRTQAFGRSLCLLPEVSSTNAHALFLAHAQAGHGTVVLAEQQTAGRGRMDRTWYSPPGFNLYTSVILRPPQDFPHLSWIPLIAGLALTESIQEEAQLRVNLKWPNDLLHDNKKLGGILCEGISLGIQQQVVIVGLGLNVHMAEHDFPEDLRPSSSSLWIQTRRTINRSTLLAGLLNAFENWYDQLLSGNLVPLHQAYTARCNTLGHEVLVQLTNHEEFVATGKAIGEDGSLHVCLKNSPEQTVRAIHSGEVTHLTMMGS